MKVTTHNILAVACATLLLTVALSPTQASTRDKEPRDTRYAQSETASNTGGKDRKKVQRKRYAQNDDAANGQNSDKQKGKRSSRSSDSPRDPDSQSETPTVSRSEAAAIAERATGGRVLSIRESGGYWQVKVLVDDKRVRVVSVDMRSGRVR